MMMRWKRALAAASVLRSACVSRRAASSMIPRRVAEAPRLPRRGSGSRRSPTRKVRASRGCGTSCSICVSDQTATVAPTLGRKSSRPSTLRRLSASRTGVRLMPSSLGEFRLLQTMAGGKASVENALAKLDISAFRRGMRRSRSPDRAPRAPCALRELLRPSHSRRSRRPARAPLHSRALLSRTIVYINRRHRQLRKRHERPDRAPTAWLSLDEAARRLGVSRLRLREAIAAGALPARRDNHGFWRVSLEQRRRRHARRCRRRASRRSNWSSCCSTRSRR